MITRTQLTVTMCQNTIFTSHKELRSVSQRSYVCQSLWTLSAVSTMYRYEPKLLTVNCCLVMPQFYVASTMSPSENVNYKIASKVNKSTSINEVQNRIKILRVQGPKLHNHNNKTIITSSNFIIITTVVHMFRKDNVTTSRDRLEEMGQSIVGSSLLY